MCIYAIYLQFVAHGSRLELKSLDDKITNFFPNIGILKAGIFSVEAGAGFGKHVAAEGDEGEHGRESHQGIEKVTQADGHS